MSLPCISTKYRWINVQTVSMGFLASLAILLGLDWSSADPNHIQTWPNPTFRVEIGQSMIMYLIFLISTNSDNKIEQIFLSTTAGCFTASQHILVMPPSGSEFSRQQNEESSPRCNFVAIVWNKTNKQPQNVGESHWHDLYQKLGSCQQIQKDYNRISNYSHTNH